MPLQITKVVGKLSHQLRPSLLHLLFQMENEALAATWACECFFLLICPGLNFPWALWNPGTSWGCNLAYSWVSYSGDASDWCSKSGRGDQLWNHPGAPWWMLYTVWRRILLLIEYHSSSVIKFLIKLARPCHHTFSSLLLLVSSDRVLPLDGPEVEILLFRSSNSIIDVCMHIYS